MIKIRVSIMAFLKLGVYMVKAPAPRGRPPKDPIARQKWEEARLAAANATQTPAEAEAKREYDAVVAETLKKIDFLGRMVLKAIQGKVRSMIVTGAPGIGKTYTCEEVLKANPVSEDAKGIRHGIVKGVVTPVNLFALLYRFRKAGSVLVLDDCDSVFEDDNAINLLKGATDTSSDRVLTYMAESNTLKDMGIPRRFRFEGALIFLSNLNMKRFISGFARSKTSDHMRALVDRAFWLDMDLHARDEVAVWVDYSVRKRKILTKSEGLSDKQASELLDWIMQDPSLMATLSLRTVVKGATLVREWPEDWRDMAATFLRNNS